MTTDGRCEKHGMLKCIRCDIQIAERLLGRWMAWASGVAFKSNEGEQVIAETDAFLGRTASGVVGQGKADDAP